MSIARRKIMWHHNRPGEEAEQLQLSTAGSNYPVRQLPFVNSGFIAEQLPAPIGDDLLWWYPLWEALDAALTARETAILETGLVMLDLEFFKKSVGNILRQRIPIHWAVCDYVRRRFPLATVGWYSIPYHGTHAASTRWHYADVLHPPAKYYKAPNGLFILLEKVEGDEMAQYVDDLDIMAPELMQSPQYVYLDPAPELELVEKLDDINSHLPSCNIIVRQKGPALVAALQVVRDWLISKESTTS